MNALHISRTMNQGGAEKIVFQLCCDNSLDKNVIASTGGVFLDELKTRGISHYIIPDIDKKNIFLILKTLFVLNRIVKSEDIDVIHSHHRMAAFYARILKIIHRNLRHIYTAHNVFYNKKRLLRFALKDCQIVACGMTVKENLINEYEIPSDRISVIYNAVDAPDYKLVECSFDKKSRICIGTIGRLTEQKGVDIFLKAVAEIKEKYPTLHAVVIGDGEDKDKLISMAKELGISDEVEFLGYRSDVFSLIKSLDFVVLSSRWEGFPLLPIEVFSMRKTIIVSDIKNNVELVQDGYNGSVFIKDSYTDLANKIEEMMDSSSRTILEENAYSTYVRNFSYSNFIEKYKKVYLGETV